MSCLLTGIPTLAHDQFMLALLIHGKLMVIGCMLTWLQFVAADLQTGKTPAIQR